MNIGRALVTIAASMTFGAALTACSGGPTTPTGGDIPATVCTNPEVSTELPAAVDRLTDSTTTAEGGAVVETSFPTAQGLPFVDVPTISSEDGKLSTTFNASTASYPVAGREISGLTYQGQFMGPTLLVDPGDAIEITLQNSLDDATNFHAHGMHTSPISTSDNVLRVMEGGTDNQVIIQIPDQVAPGTYWYHAHLHGLTEPQVMGGLSGAIVISGLNDRLPAELTQVPDHLLALKDVQLQDNAIVSTNIDSNAPTTRLVNAQVNPVITAQPGCTQLLRLGNFSADIWYNLQLDGAQFYVLAEDANVVTRVEASDTLLLPPAKRFDVLVRWDEAGSHQLKTLAYGTGPAGDSYPERVLATFNVVGEAAQPPIPMPTTMGELPSDQAPVMDDDTIAVDRIMVFSEDSDSGQFFINGEAFSDGSPLVTAKLGTTEEWTIKNVTQEEHPFHIHVNDFQIMSINGEPYNALSLQDTVPLPVDGEVVIRMRFLDFVGKYVFHCHILAHEDAGMMAVIAITEDGEPPSVQQQDDWGQPLLEHHGTP